jgi:hypothetical protein
MSEECNHIYGYYTDKDGKYVFVTRDMMSEEFEEFIVEYKQEDFMYCPKCGQYQ